MLSRQRIFQTTSGLRVVGLVCVLVLSVSSGVSQTLSLEDSSESDFELLTKAETELRLIDTDFRPIDHAKRAEKFLKIILQRSPDTPFRDHVVRNLRAMDETFGVHNFLIADFYLKHACGGTRGAESRLKQIVAEYPTFSRMDEVLLKLSQLSLDLENVEGAQYYSARLICDYPSSKSVESAFLQLNKVGWTSWEGCEALKSKPLPALKNK